MQHLCKHKYDLCKTLNNQFNEMKTTIKQLSIIGAIAIAIILSTASTFAYSSNRSISSLEITPNPSNGKPLYLTNSKYRIEPLVLNNIILSKKNIPVILNVSAYRHTPIKGSIHIGDMLDHSYADLKLALGNTPKNKEIIVYCGCCSLEYCERVEKAFDLLRAKGYTNVKVLNLVVGFDPDWKGKQYVTESFEL
jgi:rhodanese-related sulfurtransferase